MYPKNIVPESTPKDYYAALDLGSNSFHLLIGQVSNNKITIIERYSTKVRLGASVVNTGSISDEAMQRGLDCLQEFSEHIRQYPHCQIKVCGTQALRKANNAHYFLVEAEKLGMPVEIIDGQTEARWIYKGVSHALPDNDEKRLVIDIGGGSTEFAFGRQNKLHKAVSLTLGCVTLREKHFANGAITDKAWQSTKKAAKALLQEHLEEITGEFDTVYASSGTAKLLKNVCVENGFSKKHIDRNALKSLQKTLMKLSHTDDIDLPGVKENRRDLLLPGLAILLAIMDILAIKRIIFSKTALREGMLLHMHEKTHRHQQASSALASDV
ncbi:Exopolyphosphatase [BD1-7 clade bacterium]|uniref:Exopolyphosphatase n=1 Tax=BD1-7 clade bacterium TaxID=2029982 RepID=A0A5S9N200_9GAMM|nr:Exopolyphosphatase [BD1-7 clade bacterium]